jgi:hypothetical protein
MLDFKENFWAHYFLKHVFVRLLWHILANIVSCKFQQNNVKKQLFIASGVVFKPSP